VEQGIEHSGGASFAKNPDYFDPENIVKLAVEGGCNAVASTGSQMPIWKSALQGIRVKVAALLRLHGISVSAQFRRDKPARHVRQRKVG
jgi:DhnA family fructose-bisphosphate aldolase class Ia